MADRFDVCEPVNDPSPTPQPTPGSPSTPQPTTDECTTALFNSPSCWELLTGFSACQWCQPCNATTVVVEKYCKPTCDAMKAQCADVLVPCATRYDAVIELFCSDSTTNCLPQIASYDLDLAPSAPTPPTPPPPPPPPPTPAPGVCTKSTPNRCAFNGDAVFTSTFAICDVINNPPPYSPPPSSPWPQPTADECSVARNDSPECVQLVTGFVTCLNCQPCTQNATQPATKYCKSACDAMKIKCASLLAACENLYSSSVGVDCSDSNDNCVAEIPMFRFDFPDLTSTQSTTSYDIFAESNASFITFANVLIVLMIVCIV